MSDPNISVSKKRIHLKTHYGDAAKKELSRSLAEFDKQFNLLVIVSKTYRSYDLHIKSLEYAKLLVDHHPENSEGYELVKAI